MIPFRWDGTLGDLPPGIDAAGLRAVAGEQAPNAVSALAAEVDPAYQGTGLSALVIATMAAITRARRLPHLVAPIRQGLAPLTVSAGEGDYWEPNVWMVHDTRD